jgi:hypothetical protein
VNRTSGRCQGSGTRPVAQLLRSGRIPAYAEDPPSLSLRGPGRNGAPGALVARRGCSRAAANPGGNSPTRARAAGASPAA